MAPKKRQIECGRTLLHLCVGGKGFFGPSVTDVLSRGPSSRSAIVKYHKMVYEVNL